MDDSVIKVLLVEDDEDDYVFIRDLLSETTGSKYMVEWVSTYERALEQMAYSKNQVCLVDYRLGVHDGLEMLRAARERGSHLPVIFVTGQEDYEVDLKAMRSGATDYLVKSQLTGPLLERSIRYAIERYQAEEELRRAYEEMELRVEERTAELAAANAALKRSSEEIKLFAYSICHDLKNPVFAIHGFARRLAAHLQEAQGSTDEKAKEYCACIQNASEHIGVLVEKIYTFISAKETPIVVEKVALKDVLELIRQEFGGAVRQRKLEWCQPDTVPEIYADRLSVLRILRNLVENALKYGGEGLSRIAIDYKDEGGSHVISVADDGEGLKDTNPEKLFSLFYRSPASRAVKGAGLGLSIVKELARQHKGKVWVEPGGGRGATFYVSISKELQPIP
jgi:signal transduction histidine kinase